MKEVPKAWDRPHLSALGYLFELASIVPISTHYVIVISQCEIEDLCSTDEDDLVA